MNNLRLTKGTNFYNILDTKTRFHIGQKVKVLGSKRKTIVCPFCNGDYKKEIDGDDFYCANCDEGMMQLEEEEIETTGIITGINLETRMCKVDEDDKDLYSYTDNTGYKDIEYYIDIEDENIHIPIINERKLIRWNEESL